MLDEATSHVSHILKIILTEFLRYVKYSFTAPLYIFLILFPVITLILFLFIGTKEVERYLSAEEPQSSMVIEKKSSEPEFSSPFNTWLNGDTVKKDLYRWYGYATITCYLIGTVLRTVTKKLGHEIKPWTLRRKLRLFTLSIVSSYGCLYLIFRFVEGALPFWIIGPCIAIVLAIGWFTLSISHAINRLIAYIHAVDPSSLYAPRS